MARKHVDKVEELKNIYYVYGDEELLVEQALDRLKKLFAAVMDADFNMEVINAMETGAEHVVDSAETIPLLASRRLVIAKNVDKLSKKGQDIISRYMEKPNPATTLVLVASASPSGAPRDSGIVKKVENSALFRCAIASGGESLKFAWAARGRKGKVEDWIRDEFKKRGKRIEPAARDMLIEKVGRELRNLSDAVERICLYAADADTVGVEEVVKVVVPAAEQGIFEFIDSVAERRRDLSLYLLNRLIKQGEGPQKIFNLLLRQFRLIASCKSMQHTHEYGKIASELGIPPFLVGKCVKQSTKFSQERLRSIFGEFKQAQLEMYSGRYLEEGEYQGSILEMLTVKIIG
ncbi:MAG: DNA polymerase III subunit delta [Candidatus Anoxymicrobium japonicum]|uniref:DNA polymerase III subunit delta n=1 Tax=Candidatus Anoxymicrobium japonicum TaxID=2013648 RepID=A0A2N3G505_9ACTN|nr:MAG: DNA polymerase III subunit delta [Candidatus Anoxymicrobium japonicum]